MSALAAPPPEPPVCRTLDGLAPKFRAALARVVFRLGTHGWHVVIEESLRSDERQRWLYGFGRTWDDGRGIVTNVATADHGWHKFGLAVDLGDALHPNGAPPEFYRDLMQTVEHEGLTSGYDWDRDGIPVPQDPTEHFCDRPHVQWWCDGMHVSPSAHAAALSQTGGNAAVWAALHAG